jgi:hypothetical protein
VQIMCTCIYKCKNDTCWNCSRNWGGGIKESGGVVEGVNSNMIYLIHCKNLCKFHNIASTAMKENKNQIKSHVSHGLLGWETHLNC